MKSRIPTRHAIIYVLLIVAIAVVGSVLLALTKAATPFAGAEPENGTVTKSCATVVSDTAASAGKAVKFSCPAPTGTTLLSESFDSWPSGAITTTQWNTKMGGGGGTANLEDSSIVVKSGSDKSIRTFLQAHTIRSIPSGNNGVAMVVPLAKTVTEATMQYQVRFNGNFDWGWGGKLPGLAGVRSGISPSWPSGGNFAGDDGWSGRIMWNTPGSYPGSAQSPNEGLLYMYGKGQIDRYGDNVWWNKSFVANTWHTIKVHYKLNTPGQSNGTLQAWLDGNVMTNRSDYVYRSTDAVAINYLYFHVFRGGATLDWAGAVDSSIDIDNMQITTP